MADEDYKFYYTELRNEKRKEEIDVCRESSDRIIETYTNIVYVCDNILVDACSAKSDTEYIDRCFKEKNIEYDYSMLNTILIFEEANISEKISENEEGEIPF